MYEDQKDGAVISAAVARNVVRLVWAAPPRTVMVVRKPGDAEVQQVRGVPVLLCACAYTCAAPMPQAFIQVAQWFATNHPQMTLVVEPAVLEELAVACGPSLTGSPRERQPSLTATHEDNVVRPPRGEAAQAAGATTPTTTSSPQRVPIAADLGAMMLLASGARACARASAARRGCPHASRARHRRAVILAQRRV